jgi:glucokinase
MPFRQGGIGTLARERKTTPSLRSNIVLCDFGRTRLKFALATDNLDVDASITIFPTDTLNEEAHPLKFAIREYMRQRDIQPSNAHVMLSVPSFIIDPNIEVTMMDSRWKFKIDELEAELGVCSLDTFNDMMALSYGAPATTQSRRFLKSGVPLDGYPILIVSLRSGVGACGLFLVDMKNKNTWVPIQSEGGHLEIAPQTEAEKNILARIEKKLARPPTAQDVLSGNGVMALYQAICAINDDEPDDALEARLLLQRAEASEADSEHARTTIQVWCNLLGSFLRNLTLAYGAHGGVLLAGPVASSFLQKGQDLHRQIMSERFLAGGPTPYYLARIPIYMLTDPSIYLKGLARIIPSNFQGE